MNRPWKVVIIAPWDKPRFQAPLDAAGCEVVRGRSLDLSSVEIHTEQELIELFRDADAALVSPRQWVTRPVLEAAPRLRAVARAVIGVDRIDQKAATDLGILVVNSPAPENYLGVAEATVGLILALCKRMHAVQRRVREGNWRHRDFMGSSIAGKTVGIVGLGRVGTNVARRLGGWDVRLLAADPYVEPARAYSVGAQLVPLDELVRQSDVVTLHVVLTDETTRLFDESRLRAMKPTAYLVNTSRGAVIDEAALARAIEEGCIAGAALDAFEEEPLPADSPLRRLDPDRVILTPHCIGGSPGSQDTGTRMAVESIVRALRGDVPVFVANPAAIDRWRTRFPASIEP